jgi:prephenate dehydrogenase
VSHLPQLISLALVELVGARNAEDAAHLMMAAGGFRDMTRIASSPYGMWRDILTTNDAEVRRALDEFRQRLDAIERDLGDAGAHFEFANRTRAMIPRDAKGFLSPLHDVLVRVEDRPGVLAHITSALFDAGINIKDIDLLKVREGEGGTFRMGFADAETAERAINELREAGFEARLR